MLRLKKDADVRELEMLGFKKRTEKCYEFIREIDGKILYRVYTTARHQNIQVEVWNPGIISHTLQELLYNLIILGLVEKVDD